jgi:hypothetical protein
MKLLLKSTSILFFVLSLGSCCTQKEITTKTPLTCQGIVHLSENGCPYYIEITRSQEDGITVGGKIYPVELKDSYKKKGLKLAFNAVVSRAPSPADCAVDGVAVISEVVVIP